MSERNTPLSGHSSPASSQFSNRRSDSNTTPSPPRCTHGRRSTFNAHAFSSRLALLEASESLSTAAETLSVAARAMAKAAASLSLASGYQDYQYDDVGERGSMDEYVVEEPFDWQQNSYSLAPVDTSRGKAVQNPWVFYGTNKPE